ncbi:glycosyltransferase family 2 protein [Desulfonatronum thioautotrophicum]|uniref:glycosyltransferase family 2 protein n=1 Tax=Desulfonatronum thioautotrophicum TaxID=617001 RepID=UPI0005EB2B71|nr:glycosyltransferase family 2 protein [Desulfonatronum thioautotrophicum]
MSAHHLQDTPARQFSSPPQTVFPILVIIPAWNEQASIGEVVRQVRALEGFRILVVDDASTDDTADLALRAGAQVLKLPVNLGAWGAMQTGMRFAQRNGYQTVITMDADGQHLAETLPSLLSPLRDYQADVVIGSCTPRGSRARKTAWTLFRWLSGLNVRDLTSGLRAYSGPAVTLLASSRASLLDYQDVGVLLLLRKAGLRIQEVQVAMCPRRHGSSKVFSSWLKVGEYMLLTLVLCLSHCLSRPASPPQGSK